MTSKRELKAEIERLEEICSNWHDSYVELWDKSTELSIKNVRREKEKAAQIASLEKSNTNRRKNYTFLYDTSTEQIKKLNEKIDYLENCSNYWESCYKTSCYSGGEKDKQIAALEEENERLDWMLDDKLHPVTLPELEFDVEPKKPNGEWREYIHDFTDFFEGIRLND